MVYTLVYAAKPAPVLPEKPDWTPLFFWAGGILIIGMLGIVGYILFSKRRRMEIPADGASMVIGTVERTPRSLEYFEMGEDDDEQNDLE